MSLVFPQAITLIVNIFITFSHYNTVPRRQAPSARHRPRQKPGTHEAKRHPGPAGKTPGREPASPFGSLPATAPAGHPPTKPLPCRSPWARCPKPSRRAHKNPGRKPKQTVRRPGMADAGPAPRKGHRAWKTVLLRFFLPGYFF